MTAAAVKSRPSNLAAELTSFVGRRRELADVKQRLTTTRLLTLVGPGGIGKTRLATRAAAEMMRAYSDGGSLSASPARSASRSRRCRCRGRRRPARPSGR